MKTSIYKNSMSKNKLWAEYTKSANLKNGRNLETKLSNHAITAITQSISTVHNIFQY